MKHHNSAVNPGGGSSDGPTAEHRRHLREHWRLAGIPPAGIAYLAAALDHADAATFTTTVGLRRIAHDLGRTVGTVAHYFTAAQHAGVIAVTHFENGAGAVRRFVLDDLEDCELCEEIRRAFTRDLAAHGLRDWPEPEKRAEKRATASRASQEMACGQRDSSRASQQIARDGVARFSAKARDGIARKKEVDASHADGGNGRRWAGVDDDGYAIETEPQPRTEDDDEADDELDPEPPFENRVAHEEWMMRTYAPEILANQQRAARRRQLTAGPR